MTEGAATGLREAIASLDDLTTRLRLAAQKPSDSTILLCDPLGTLFLRLQLLASSLQLIFRRAPTGVVPLEATSAIEWLLRRIIERVKLLENEFDPNKIPSSKLGFYRSSKTHPKPLKPKEKDKALEYIHQDIDSLLLYHSALYSFADAQHPKEINASQSTGSQQSLIRYSHQFTGVTARDHSFVHLGDVYLVNGNQGSGTSATPTLRRDLTPRYGYPELQSQRDVRAGSDDFTGGRDWRLVSTELHPASGESVSQITSDQPVLDVAPRVPSRRIVEDPSYRLPYPQVQKRVNCTNGLTVQYNNAFFGARFSFTTTTTSEVNTKTDTNGDIELEPVFTTKKYLQRYYPNSLLQLLGLRIGFDLVVLYSQQGWRCKFNVFHAVPSDAPIFALSRQGDVNGVRDLLLRKNASVWDIDERGNSALHYAAAGCHIELCYMLVHAGADVGARNYDTFYVHNKTPLTMMCEGSGSPASKIEAMRLFARQIDYWDHECEGWDVIVCLLHSDNEGCCHLSDLEPFRWVLNAYATDIKSSCVRDSRLRSALVTTGNSSAFKAIMQTHKGVVSESFNTDSYSRNLLHYKMYEFYLDPADLFGILKLLAEAGIDLHTETTVGESCKQASRSPTSLAMRYSSLFHVWKKLLRYLKHDFKAFIEIEFRTSSELENAGWTEETLLRLFETDFEPRDLGRQAWRSVCINNGCSRIVEPEEPWWQRLCEDIRTQRNCSAQFQQSRHSFKHEYWLSQYQVLDAIPRSSGGTPKSYHPCHLPGPSSDDTTDGPDNQRIPTDLEQKDIIYEMSRGFCLAWPSLCEHCDPTAEQARADPEWKRERKISQDDGHTLDGLESSMFFLDLDMLSSTNTDNAD
ncbi:hypothetical protein LTS08_003461 [Lithohypha guttulata]|nr:hypothetical protein LTS08_003461 [Lithohypha guttulata]